MMDQVLPFLKAHCEAGIYEMKYRMSFPMHIPALSKYAKQHLETGEIFYLFAQDIFI